MTRFFPLLLTGVLAVAGALTAQPAGKKALDLEAFERWNEIDHPQISSDGRWVTYVLQPGRGDSELHIYSAAAGADWRYSRAGEGLISADSRFVVFAIKPPLDTTNALRRRKVKPAALPPDTLGIYDLQTGELQRVANLKSFTLPEKWAGWVAYTLEPDSLRQQKGKDKKLPLALRNLATGEEIVVPAVTDFVVAKEGAAVLLASAGRDSTFLPGVYRFDGQAARLSALFRAKGSFRQLQLDDKGEQAAFLADLDTSAAAIRPFDLYFWHAGRDSARLAVTGHGEFMPDGWRISENGALRFSADGARLFFGVAPNPLLPDTTLLEEEIVNVEVWNYRDPYFYTVQENRLNQDKKRTYLSVWHIKENKAVQLADEQTPEAITGDEGNAAYALALDELPYALETTWEGGPACKDVYLVDVNTGAKKLIAAQVCGRPDFSPAARYIYWYSAPDSTWAFYSVERNTLLKLSSPKKAPFYDELNDRPEHPSSYGMAGWTTSDDFVLLYDRYDIWLIDPRGNMPPNNLTQGRKDRRRYRYIRLDPEERAIEEVARSLFHVFDERTKREGYAWFNVHTGLEGGLLSSDHAYSRRVWKARQADRFLFTREDFQTFPDLCYTGDFKTFKTVSRANPQQGDYRWGTAELVTWTSLTGEDLNGILYKPDDFDPQRQYPMMVYFYERMSDELHQYTTPRPSRSSINFAHYVSRGYLVFVPDIPYRVGYPGESAVNAVVPGVAALISRGFVDRSRIGVQGHSWGGYQTAYLITETDLFRCAEAGAPVVNMFSAYGGIRWGSGLVRQFQYERSQSRIGGSIWAYPLRFLENSPLFFADKINTPVLILHNDEDTAVPWEQGIEFFAALRRLGKPAWLLNYNGEPHGIQKWQNKMDFSHRMQQFFDYYLLDGPKPQWMERGVPAIEKGIKQGLEPAVTDEK